MAFFPYRSQSQRQVQENVTELTELQNDSEFLIEKLPFYSWGLFFNFFWEQYNMYKFQKIDLASRITIFPNTSGMVAKTPR